MNDMTNVKIMMDGEDFDFEMKKSETILDAALENDIDLPYSCQSGVCTACQGKLISGSVDMDVSDGLSDEEISEGYILCCQSIPSSDLIEVEID
ncbi:MAG: 2Fe-2S iron-sulfur cluster binding domain-containing protein [Bacteroidota bacterium]|jgi:ring-1,2-phenylacetyl-CoA epoxidase subunit PaaE|nr:2Fe-2S iron-sulfur cluster binding domain-containing protein [Bacteroidota bacterium]|tara:strand:- start:1481 stop:1762 length:282 start_codon:yes stop_codon:yes gene_type:complete